MIENAVSRASRPVLTIDSSKSVKDAAEFMAARNLRRLAVVQEGKVIGVFSAFHLIRMLATGLDPSQRPLAEANIDVPVYVDPTSSIIEAAKVMASRDVTAVLVGREPNPIGILTTHDLVSAMSSSYVGSARLHEALVNTYPTVDPGATLLEAASIISSRGTSGVIVMDGDDLLGVLTVRDVVQTYAAGGLESLSAKVGDVPMPPAAYIDEGGTVSEATEAMEARGTDVAVVLCGPKVCGGVDDISLSRWLASKY